MRLLFFFLCCLVWIPVDASAADKPTQIVRDARSVLEDIMKIPETGIPATLFSQARGIAILPGMIKAGLIVGGRFGTGVLLIRDAAGAWSDPIFLSLVGGSVGWQIGAQSTDVILVFKSEKSVKEIFDGKVTMGADAGVAAGPVGRRVEGSTDLQLKAEIFSYSRSRGLFAGVSLDGASLAVDGEANSAFYQKDGITPGHILAGEVGERPIAARRLQMDLTKYAETTQ